MFLAMKTRNVIGAFRSFVTVKQSFIVSQIVGCPVILSKLVFLSRLYGAGNC